MDCLNTAAAYVEKDKGNTAFRAGAFSSAINHYTTAIHLDQADISLPLNRAAAYLKICRYEEAERDCTTALALHITNAKALFRRSQAWVGQNKFVEAHADLMCALSVAPGDAAIERELRKVSSLLESAQMNSSMLALSGDRVSLSTPVEMKMRRLPIRVVERPPNPAVSAPSMSTITTNSVMPKLAANDLTERSRGRIPTTLSTFTRSWQSLPSPEERWRLLSTLSPTALPVMFGSSIEPTFLTSLFETFIACLDSGLASPTAIKDYLLALQQVSRFTMVVLFMTGKEKELMNSVCLKLGFSEQELIPGL